MSLYKSQRLVRHHIWYCLRIGYRDFGGIAKNLICIQLVSKLWAKACSRRTDSLNAIPKHAEIDCSTDGYARNRYREIGGKKIDALDDGS